MAVTILISPFFISPGYPLLYVGILSLALIYTKKDCSPMKKFITVYILTCSALIIAYVFLGYTNIASAVWIGSEMIMKILVCLTVFIVFVEKCVTSERLKKPVLMAGVLALVFLCAFSWAGTRTVDDKELKMSYKEAQLWARENTGSQALFMVDPKIYYGWQDYSRRSSFGNLREWVFTSWQYNSDRDIFNEGMRRFNEFSIDMDEYMRMEPQNRHRLDMLYQEVSRRYNAADDMWRLNMANRYGIDYFLFVKKNIITPSRFPVAYENEDIIIYKAGR